MKAIELAMWLMQNPDADVRFILKTNWHLELTIEDKQINNNNAFINLLLKDDEIVLKVEK